jgi:ubiquinone/menaquinone biosynthesis C-methylase UbiE
MRPEDFEYLYKLEEEFWWFPAMREITDVIVGRELSRGPLTILDAGCGTGFNIKHFQDQGHTVFAFDIASDAVAGVKKRGFTRLCQASATEIPFQAASFDVVFLFDVISQVPVAMEQTMIAEVNRVLKPGGCLFVRTAAFEWLRSSHDEELATYHRYTRRELEHQLSSAGFKVLFSTYANYFLFPAVAVRRFLKRFGVGGGTDVKPLPASLAWINPIFRNVLASEAQFFKRGFSLPFGLSAICFARKGK